MTDQQIADWKVERDIARAIKNDEDRRVALQAAYDHRDEMQMTCIAHQSARQKELIGDVASLKADVKGIQAEMKPLKEHQHEVSSFKERAKGAKWVVYILVGLGTKFGWDFVGQVLTALHGAAQGAAH